MGMRLGVGGGPGVKGVACGAETWGGGRVMGKAGGAGTYIVRGIQGYDDLGVDVGRE